MQQVGELLVRWKESKSQKRLLKFATGTSTCQLYNFSLLVIVMSIVFLCLTYGEKEQAAVNCVHYDLFTCYH